MAIVSCAGAVYQVDTNDGHYPYHQQNPHIYLMSDVVGEAPRISRSLSRQRRLPSESRSATMWTDVECRIPDSGQLIQGTGHWTLHSEHRILHDCQRTSAVRHDSLPDLLNPSEDRSALGESTYSMTVANPGVTPPLTTTQYAMPAPCQGSRIDPTLPEASVGRSETKDSTDEVRLCALVQEFSTSSKVNVLFTRA